MTEGTRSYLIGSHHWLIHPLAIIRAWRKHHGSYPRPWEVACICLHDIGIVGMQYLSGSKDGHWRRGASVARGLFGAKGWNLCAGHCIASGYPRSNLLFPDKACWLYVPKPLMEFWHLIEGHNRICTVNEWLASVRERMERGFEEDAHAVYLAMREAAGGEVEGG